MEGRKEAKKNLVKSNTRLCIAHGFLGLERRLTGRFSTQTTDHQRNLLLWSLEASQASVSTQKSRFSYLRGVAPPQQGQINCNVAKAG